MVAFYIYKKIGLFTKEWPPLAVRMIFSIGLRLSPTRHWNMAECSLSTGIIGALFSEDVFITISPATTSVSLLASATVFPFSRAFNVGF
jgi:hypothetical protein